MLVVTRRRNESVMIDLAGDGTYEVEVKITGIRENHVRIGIIAPRKVPVHRREVYERIKAGEPPRRPEHRDWKPRAGSGGAPGPAHYLPDFLYPSLPHYSGRFDTGLEGMMGGVRARGNSGYYRNVLYR